MGRSGSVVCGWVATLRGERLLGLRGSFRCGLLVEIKKGSVVLRGLRDWDGEVGSVKIVAEAEEESNIAIMGLFLGLQFCDSEALEMEMEEFACKFEMGSVVFVRLSVGFSGD